MGAKVWLGIDAHQDTVMIAVLVGEEQEPRETVRLPNDPKRIKRFVERWAETGEIRACYEASGGGYVLQRWMRDWGYSCEVVAPSLIPQRPGHKRKHDRYDARELARHYRSGDLVVVRVPSEAEERVRDVVRCRERFRKEILQSRHSVTKFLARRGLIWQEKSRWTKKHWDWIRGFARDGVLPAEDRLVLSEYVALLEYKISRRDELDRVIEEMALRPAYKEAVAHIGCFRGFDTHSSMVLATEIVDFRRFQPAKLMSFVGLVPSEESSGKRERRGAITKAGNSHCRHVLVQAAWSYQHPPRVGAKLKRRQQGQPPEVVAHAWKAQHRLHKLFKRVAAKRGKQVATVAVARELVGFIWAVMQHVEAGERTASSGMRQAA
jgi:transposase